jgi:hypothetical protein
MTHAEMVYRMASASVGEATDRTAIAERFQRLEKLAAERAAAEQQQP